MRALQGLWCWMGSRGAWFRSRFSDLPQLRADATSEVNHYCVVAGGLALILSRRPPRELASRFMASQELHQLLRCQLRGRGHAEPNAELLSEVMHEVATVADPSTRAALRTCLAARCADKPGADRVGRDSSPAPGSASSPASMDLPAPDAFPVSHTATTVPAQRDGEMDTQPAAVAGG